MWSASEHRPGGEKKTWGWQPCSPAAAGTSAGTGAAGTAPGAGGAGAAAAGCSMAAGLAGSSHSHLAVRTAAASVRESNRANEN